MKITHVAVQGDCVESIAAQYWTTPERILDLDDNASLFQLRKDRNVLLPGDVVVVPRDPKTATAQVGTAQQFVVTRPKTRLKVRLVDSLHLPRKGVSYTLVYGDQTISGQTDDDGNVDQPIPSGTQTATLQIGDDGSESYDLNLGFVDPIDAVTGVQARLNNLGHDAGDEDGVLGPRTAAAITEFQASRGLPQTGAMDDATQDALLDTHGQ